MAEVKETFSPDNLIAGDYPIVTEAVIVLNGLQSLTRGAVLGQITSGGQYKITDPQASDGSENPKAILINTISGLGSAVTVPAYISGEFNDGVITLGGTGVAADVKVALRDLNIYLKAVSDR